MGKRHRHRRALMRMLFDYYETDRLVICLDPGNIELLEDFGRDRATTRLLEIECQFADDYLIGHAMRVGLAGARTPRDTISRLLPSVRNDMLFESDRIRDAQFDNHLHMREIDTVEVNARAVAAFLTIPEQTAREIVALDHLFAD
jgi:hypothetical protein